MKRNKGFVLTELLVAVGILIISFSIIGVEAGKINKSLKQTEVEAMARDIYVSAQSNLTMIKSSGAINVFEQREFTYDPTNYDGDTLNYIYSNDKDKESFFSQTLPGNWVIEYNKQTGLVYGVFYSNDSLDFYTTTEDDDELRRASHEKMIEFADENNYNVGYYGGTLDVDKIIVEEKDIPEVHPQYPPEEPEDTTYLADTGFVYWEIYDDNTYGIYYVYDFDNMVAHGKDLLYYGTDKVVVSDGYGIAISKDTNNYLYVDRKGSINNVVCYSADGFADLESTTGYLYKFPKEWYDENENDDNAYFYTRLGFWIFDTPVAVPSGLSNPYPIYVNMRMAKNGIFVGKGNTNPIYDNASIYGPLYIRSARQLYDLSLYYNLWAIGAEGVQMIQDINIDYLTYNWSDNSLVTNVMPIQQPIGTNAFNSKESKGTCMLNYDGKGYSINNICISAANGYSGLFSRLRDYPYRRDGKLVDSGIVKNLTVNCIKLDSAKYVGAIAGYVEKNAQIINCNSNTILYGASAKGAIIK